MHRLLLLVVLVGGAGVRAQPAAPFALVNVTVLDLEDARLVPGQTILVSDGRIAQVGPPDEVPLPDTLPRVDGRGGYVMAGLVDMHAHLHVPAGIHSGQPVYAEEDAQTLSLMVAHGVTTIRSLWGSPSALRLREAVRRGDLVGPRIVTAGPLIDQRAASQRGTPWHPTELAERPEILRIGTRADGHEAALYHAGAGYDILKVYNGVGEEAYAGLVETARALGLPVVGHIPDALGLLRMLTWPDVGHASIEHTASFVEASLAPGSALPSDPHERDLARWTAADPDRLAMLAEMTAARGVPVTPTLVLAATRYAAPTQREPLLASLSRARTTEAQRARWIATAEAHAAESRSVHSAAVLDVSLRLTGALHRAGVTLLVGTDAPAALAGQGAAVHDELALLVRAGLTPLDALRAATAAPHAWLRAWGLSDGHGRVAAGEPADLLLLRSNPLDDIRHTRSIEGVVLRGRWLDRRALDTLLGT